LDEIRKVHLLTRRMIAGLSLVDERSYRAGLLGANQAFLYQPAQKRAKKAQTISKPSGLIIEVSSEIQTLNSR